MPRLGSRPAFVLSAFAASLFIFVSPPPAAFGSDPGATVIDPCTGPSAATDPRCTRGPQSPVNRRQFDLPLQATANVGAGPVNLTRADILANGLGKALDAANNPTGGLRAPVRSGGGSPVAGDAGTSAVEPAGAPGIAPFGENAGDSALAIKAGVELQLGDLAAACEDARAALKADPKDAKALKIESLACRAALSSGQKDVAAEGLKPGPAGREVALDANSRSKLLRGDRGGGAVVPGPGALQAWIVRIEEVKAGGDDVQVILLCDTALREFPGNLHLLNAKATAQNRLKDYKAALATADEALDIDGRNAVAYANKAFALGGLGDREGMLAALRAAAALDPQFEAALKAALAGDAAGLFGDVGAARGAKKPLPMLTWVLGAAGAGFLLMLILVVFAKSRSARPAPSSTEATVIAPARELAAGTVLGGNFRIDGELGRGGMGVVYDAFDEKLQRRVAIKQLQRGADASADSLARFIREARLVAQLKHPNLAEIYTVLDEKGEFLLVFEFVDGRTLDKVIAANRRLPPAQAEKILGGIAAGLDYAHARKIIHRDLKPSNIMIARDGAVKIMDFGIAHQATTAGATQTVASGTPPYMSPEQGMGSVSTSSDLYALGVMAYEMVCGVRPFDGPDFLEQKLRKSFTPTAQREGALPAGLDAFFAAVLDPDPTRRPPTGAALLQAFRQGAGLAG